MPNNNSLFNQKTVRGLNPIFKAAVASNTLTSEGPEIKKNHKASAVYLGSYFLWELYKGSR